LIGAALMAALLSASSVRTSSAGETWLDLHGGFTVLHIGLPALPVFPVLAGEIAIRRGLSDRFEIGARYRTHVGTEHRLGPELRLAILEEDPGAIGVWLYPSASISGGLEGESADVGGDLATDGGLIGELRFETFTIALEVGLAIDWLVYAKIAEDSFVDAAPFLTHVDLALEVSWLAGEDTVLRARLEVPASLSPDDPFTIFGVVPRATFGASVRL
jgi:hypothetical protein